jgi:hypothetical protein
MPRDSIKIKWYRTDQEPIFKSTKGSDTVVLEADGVGVFEGGCTVALHVDQECKLSEVTQRVDTLMQSVREGIKRGNRTQELDKSC